MNFNWFKKASVKKIPEKIWMTRQRKFQGVVEDALTNKQQNNIVIVVAFFRDSFTELQRCFKDIPHVPCLTGFSASTLRCLSPDNTTIFLVMADALPVDDGVPITKEETNIDLRVSVVIAEHYPIRSKEEAVEQFVASLPYSASLCVQSSLDEELFVKYGAERILPIMRSLGVDDNQPLEHPLLAKSIANAQEKIKKVATSDMRSDSAGQWFELNCRGKL